MPHTKDFYNHIHNCILKTWKFDIEHEYNECYIFNEATLVNDFYYHLRRRIGEWDNIRIFTEYPIEIHGKKFKADMVIVRIGENELDVKEIISILEFKYKREYALKCILEDFEKTKSYIKQSDLPSSCRFYVVSIIVSEHMLDIDHYLDGRSYWANDTLTELNAFWNNDDCNADFYIFENGKEVTL